MEKSQNGWVASPHPSDLGVVPLKVAGVDFPGGCRGGAIHDLFMYVLTRWHHEVEALHRGWCWGGSYRPNRNNPNELSNHASYTAVDINAPRHPNGKRGTYTRKQRAAIKRILADVDNVLRSGEFFLHTTDGMHLEVNAPLSAVQHVVDGLRAKGLIR